MKKVLICVWGPELGCLMREIQLAKRLIETGNFEVSFYCHRNHTRVIQNFLGYGLVIHIYDNMLSIKYCHRFDLLPFQTILAAARFISGGMIPEYGNFKRIVNEVQPDFVINDFLPHASIYTKIMGIPCIGIQNYICPKIYNSGSITEFLFWFGFNYSYGLHDFNFVETLFPETLPKIDKITWTTPVAYSVDRTRDSINIELGITNKEKLVFLALGGASENLSYLKEIHDLASEYPDIRILLLPRNDNEVREFPVVYPDFLHTGKVIYDTYNYVGNSDIVISKCGFRTVAESLANGVTFIPFHTPSHPEIYQTEELLQKKGITNVSILKTDTSHQFWNKIVTSFENSNSGNYPFILCNGDKEISDHLQQYSDRIIKYMS